jgi:ATP-dependent DNA ligase
MHLNGKDLRGLPLIERKQALRRIVPKISPFLMFVDHVEGQGESLFELVRERNLEGIVAKHRQSRYVVENGNPAWVKIRNRRYSQMAGRDALFEKRYEAAGAPKIGCDVCARATAASGV